MVRVRVRVSLRLVRCGEAHHSLSVAKPRHTEGNQHGGGEGGRGLLPRVEWVTTTRGLRCSEAFSRL